MHFEYEIKVNQINYSLALCNTVIVLGYYFQFEIIGPFAMSPLNLKFE